MQFNDTYPAFFICFSLIFSANTIAMTDAEVAEIIEPETEQTTPVEQNTTTPLTTTVEITEKEGIDESESTQTTVETKKVKAATSSSNDELDALAEEIKRLKLEISKMELLEQKARLKTNLEKQALVLENELQAAKQKQSLAALKSQITQIETENALRVAERQRMHAYLSDERKRLQLQNGLIEERNRQRGLELKQDMLETKLEIDKLTYQLSERKKREEWKKEVNQAQAYTKEPFVDGHLTITDRRVLLEGPIWYGVADYIVERIEYFNNQSAEYPIFLVINYSPGGSVMEGMRILKAMQKSRAPVYVVVKSFAASMAAVLATLAEKSFAYPDTVFVHHQVWGFSMGNKREQQEQLVILDEWAKRLTQPVAEKMGLTLEEFVQQMYEHNSVGDWTEFADGAAKVKWVDHVISDIRDTSYYKKPKEPGEDDDDSKNNFSSQLNEQLDAEGHHFVKVPHLKPLDVYHMYNPDNYYRQ